MFLDNEAKVRNIVTFLNIVFYAYYLCSLDVCFMFIKSTLKQQKYLGAYVKKLNSLSGAACFLLHYIKAL